MSDTTASPCAAMLEHLTGPSRGTCAWIAPGRAEAWLAMGNRLVVTEPGAGPEGAALAARLTCTPDGVEIEAAEGADLWVNRRPVRAVTLLAGDMIEFGEKGPLSRFRLYDATHRPTPTIGEILGDSLSYMRSSRRPLGRRVPWAAADTVRRLAWDTTLLFRGAVLLSLLILAVAVGYLQWSSTRLRADLESGGLQVEAISAEVAEARREAIRAGDLKALSDELQARMAANVERLETLESRSGAAARIIAGAAPMVAFLQGAYGLRDRDSGRMLRHAVGPGGLPLMGPTGRPLLTLEGEGPVAEVQFNGTGFRVQGGLLVTNRHVARPWENSPGISAGDDGMEPVMLRFIAYLPGRADPLALSEAAVDDAVDLAVLHVEGIGGGDGGLVLAGALPKPGEQVIVMGYPTGLMSLLAQSGAQFVEELRQAGETGFWEVAQRLAQAGLIAPLSSGGIVGQATPAAVVYDAETTHGGSGGPVLNLRGEVIAVNTAIMPEFGGSNLGVPATLIAPLLAPGG